MQEMIPEPMHHNITGPDALIAQSSGHQQDFATKIAAGDRAAIMPDGNLIFLIR